MSNYEKMMLQQRGWRDGAGGRAMETGLTGEVDTIYSRGYTEGRKARAKANIEVAANYGITPQEIMLSCLRG